MVYVYGDGKCFVWRWVMYENGDGLEMDDVQEWRWKIF